MNQIELPQRVDFDMYTTPHFKEPSAKFKREHPMQIYCAMIGLNGRRISGPSDYNVSVIHSTTIDTKEILKALNIPNEIINQIKFVNN